jgi:hypothetical protein
MRVTRCRSDPFDRLERDEPVAGQDLALSLQVTFQRRKPVLSNGARHTRMLKKD